MTRTRDLVVGLVELLDGSGVGTYEESGVYAPDFSGTSLSIRSTPSHPDRVVTVTPYTVSDTVEGHRVQGVQLRTRGAQYDPLDVDDLDDQIYTLLHGREDLVLRGVRVHKMFRVSHGTLGQDADYRTENTSNYYALVDAPTPGTR